MTYRLHIHSNNAHRWHHQGPVHVRGFAIIDGVKYSDSALCTWLQTHTSIENAMPSLNGQFALVVASKSSIIMAVDRLRSYPLFYCIEGNELIIADNVKALYKEYLTINSQGVSELLSSGYCHGENTLYQEISQIDTGQVVTIFDKNSIHKKFYHRYHANHAAHKTSEELIEHIHQVAKDLITTLDGRQAVIPLSGGYDSRLIAAMLKNQKYDRIIAFTYGKAKSLEIPFAQSVANKLNIPWHRMHYENIVPQNFLQDANFQSYNVYASNASSMFYLQDYFAVRQLKEKKLIAEDAVFIPGHTGDILSGGHLSKEMLSLDSNMLQKKILNDHCNFRKKNLGTINSLQFDIQTLPWLNYENWEMKNRQAKFIVNSVRIFEHFGHDFLIPLWHNKMMDFFVNLPLQQKIHSALYRQTLKHYIFEPLQIAFHSEMYERYYQRNWLAMKNSLKNILPSSMLNYLLPMHDSYVYKEVIHQMENDGFVFEEPRKINNWNAYISQWVVRHIESTHPNINS